MYNITDDGNFHSEEGFHPIRSTTNEASQSNASNMTPLPANFEPGPDDVICGRGKKCYNHIGNERFRLRVLTYLEEYSAAKSKLEKSGVLSKVVDAVRQQSPDGGFVKQDDKGNWHEVGDFLAREKTSQSFRDALHDRYKSSNISKKKRRQDEQSRQTTSSTSSRAMMIQEPRSDYEMSTRLERLSNELLNSRKSIIYWGNEIVQNDPVLTCVRFALNFSINLLFHLLIFTEELHEIDFFNRRNSDVIAAAQGYDLQLQGQLPQRIQPSAVQQYLGSNRRYSSGNMDFYAAARERPVNEMARLPDPLFGTARNTINATPSDFVRERGAIAPHEFDRERSVNPSEPEYNRSEHIAYAPLDAKSYHASQYPEMVYPNIFDDFSLHQQPSIHQTFPDSVFVKRGQTEGDRKRPAKEMEPAPYEQGNFPARRSRKSAVPETFMKKVATNPYPVAAAPASVHSDVQYPSSLHQQSTRMVGGQRISRDLMDCLDKMTYHSIADDNPFEPIPLAPHQEAALNINRRSSDVSAVDSYHQQSQQHPTIDESERDEFAEG